MDYVLLAIIASILLFFWLRQKKIRSRIPCERCGEIGSTIFYFASTNDTTRDYCKVFDDFLYKKPLNFCLQCAVAHDSFLRALIMLSIEKQQKLGNNVQIEEAEKNWGDRAIDILALLEVARGSMDSARRILREEEFKKVKPWIEKMLGNPTSDSTKNNSADDLLEQIKSLRWGISKAEYQKIFSDKSWQPEHPTNNAVIFGDTYLEYPVFITAYFFDETNKLGRLVLGYSNLPDNELKEVYQKIIDGLTKNYGAPQFSETPENDPMTPPEFRISELKTWKTSDSVISTTFALAESGTTMPGIGVIWGDKEK